MDKVRASHILVADRNTANSLRVQIQEGKDFSEMAKQWSSCPSGRNGGDLGEFGRGMMVKPFEDAAFTSPVGAVSEPVQTQFGWHLIVRTG
jgi:peptidyl-prolyl cis-trans isomerase C